MVDYSRTIHVVIMNIRYLYIKWNGISGSIPNDSFSGTRYPITAKKMAIFF